MHLTLESTAVGSPELTRSGSVRLVAAAPRLWRVVERGGRVIGHVQAIGEAPDIRYRARRFHAPSRAFRDLGDFWAADDAVECITFGR